MKYCMWKKYYVQILEDFNFSEAKDILAAKLLSKLLKNRNKVVLEKLKSLVEKRDVYIFGGATRKKDVLDLKFSPMSTIITADGTTSVLLRAGIVPNIVTTDLDGNVLEQVYANANGTLVVIHAHGDNIPNLRKWVPLFKGVVLGTTQSKPFGNIHNFGGFTDGDRAVFLAEHFKANKIVLVGFDFERVRGAKPKKKLKKLAWARRLIGELSNPDIIMVGSG